MASKNVDTPREGSWAEQEEARRNAAAPDQGLPEWWGKPSVLIPNLVTLGPIDPKYARIFNG